MIQDMFQITDEYIEREYTIAGNHLMLTSEHTAKEIEQKAKKVVGMLKAWCEIYTNAVQCVSYIRKVETEQISRMITGGRMICMRFE